MPRSDACCQRRTWQYTQPCCRFAAAGEVLFRVSFGYGACGTWAIGRRLTAHSHPWDDQKYAIRFDPAYSLV